MRTFLCTEFLDFTATRFADLDVTPCVPTTCPGPAHARTLATAVGRRTGVPPGLLLQLFGSALFDRLTRDHPGVFAGIGSTLDLLARFDERVAATLTAIDHTVALPRVRVVREPDGPVEVVYQSREGLADVAEGMLRGSLIHFREPLELRRRAETPSAGVVVFALSPHPTA
jgi:hypothetical protein